MSSSPARFVPRKHRTFSQKESYACEKGLDIDMEGWCQAFLFILGLLGFQVLTPPVVVSLYSGTLQETTCGFPFGFSLRTTTNRVASKTTHLLGRSANLVSC